MKQLMEMSEIELRNEVVKQDHEIRALAGKCSKLAEALSGKETLEREHRVQLVASLAATVASGLVCRRTPMTLVERLEGAGSISQECASYMLDDRGRRNVAQDSVLIARAIILESERAEGEAE